MTTGVNPAVADVAKTTAKKAATTTTDRSVTLLPREAGTLTMPTTVSRTTGPMKGAMSGRRTSPSRTTGGRTSAPFMSGEATTVPLMEATTVPPTRGEAMRGIQQRRHRWIATTRTPPRPPLPSLRSTTGTTLQSETRTGLRLTGVGRRGPCMTSTQQTTTPVLAVQTTREEKRHTTRLLLETTLTTRLGTTLTSDGPMIVTPLLLLLLLLMTGGTEELGLFFCPFFFLFCYKGYLMTVCVVHVMFPFRFTPCPTPCPCKKSSTFQAATI